MKYMSVTCTDIVKVADRTPYSYQGETRYQEIDPAIRQQVQKALEQLASVPEGQALLEDIRRVQQTDTKGPVMIYIDMLHMGSEFASDARTVTLGWHELLSTDYRVEGGAYIGASVQSALFHELGHASDPRVAFDAYEGHASMASKLTPEEFEKFEEEAELYAQARMNAIMTKYYGRPPEVGYWDSITREVPRTEVIFYPDILFHREEILSHRPCKGTASPAPKPAAPGTSGSGTHLSEPLKDNIRTSSLSGLEGVRRSDGGMMPPIQGTVPPCKDHGKERA
jgi:hypothetical protein